MVRSGPLAVPLCDRDVWGFGEGQFEPLIRLLFLPLQMVVWYLFQIASAVSCIHRAGILHR